MKSQSVGRQELEIAIYSKTGEPRKSSFASKLGRILSQIFESIVAVNELKIYSPSKSSSAYWTVHEPFLGRRTFFNSEAEVRAWLDRRYYQ